MLNWFNGTSDTSWVNANNDTAAFWGTAGTVTLTDAITVGGLLFNTTGYTLTTGANTLTFGATDNVITLNNIAAATITGTVGGAGNVTLTGGIRGGQTAGTLTLNGTSTGGWSGTTTINNGMTLALAANNQALLNTTGITLNGGGITLTNTTAGEAALDRISNGAGITSNGGTITVTNTASASINYSESIGTVALTSGRLTINQANNNTSPSTQSLILGGLTRTGGATNTSTINFAGTSLGSAAQNRILITGQAVGDLGPWAIYNNANFAAYDATNGIIAATATTLAAGSNSAATNFNTTAGSITLTAALNPSYKTLLVTGGTVRTTAINGNTVSVGGISSTGATHVISGTGAVQALAAGDSLFIHVGANALTFSSVIQNVAAGATASSVVMSGAGTLTLGGVNTYTGNTIINSGTVSVAADNNLGVGGSIIFNGSGTLTATTTTTAFTNARAITINNGAMATYNIGNIGGPTLSGAITGTGGLILQSSTATARTFTLSNTNNTFQGALVIGGSSTSIITAAVASLADSATANGAIRLGNTTQMGTFQWTTAATGALVLNNRQIDLAGTTGGGTLDSASTTAGESITVNTDLLISGVGAKTLTLTGANTGTNAFNGKIFDGAGTVISVTKSAASTWVLGGDNTYTGATTVSAGTLRVTGNQSGSTSVVTISPTGTYTLSGANGQASTGGITVNATGVLNVDNTTASGGIKLNRLNTAVTLAGGQFNYNLGGSAGVSTDTITTLTLGAGVGYNASGVAPVPSITLGASTSGASSLTVTTLTRSAGGTLLVSGANLGAAAGTGNTNLIVNNGGVGAGVVGGTGLAGTSTISINSFIVGQDTALTGNAQFGFTTDRINGVSLADGLRTLTTAEYSATITNGQTALDNVSLSTELSGINSATTINALRLDLGASVSGSGTLSVNSGAILALGNTPTFSRGANSISGGTLAFGSQEAIFHTIYSDLTVNSTVTGSAGLAKTGNGTLIFGGSSNSIAGPVSISSGMLRAAAVGAVNTTGALTIANRAGAILDLTGMGTTTLGFGATVGSLAGGGSLGGQIILGGGATLTVGGDNTSTTYASVISGNGNLVKSGSGTLTLAAANTYTGMTTVSGGTLINGIANSIATVGGLTVTSPGIFDLSAGAVEISSLTGSGTVTSTAAARALTLGNRLGSVDSTFSGVFNGGVNLTLTKTGGGTLTLSGATSAATGAWTLNAGTVKLNFSTTNTNILAATMAPTISGGTLNITGRSGQAVSQTLGIPTIGSGGATIIMDPNGGTAGTSLVLGAQVTNGPLLIRAPTNTNVTLATAITAALANGRVVFSSDTTYSGGVLQAVSNVDWATNAAAGNVSGATTYTADLGGSSVSGTNTNNSLINNSTINQTTTVSAPWSTNTLKINAANSGQSLDLGTTTLTLSGGGLLYTGANDYTISGGVGGTLLSTLDATNSNLVVHTYGINAGVPTTLTIGAVIGNGTGAQILTKAGPGILKLTGTNTYTGATLITGGTLSISANANLGTAGATAITITDGSTLQVTGGATVSTLTRTYSLTGGTATIDLVNAGTQLTAGGTISGAGGLNLTNSGTGTSVFTNTVVATYTGPTTIGAGVQFLAGVATPLVAAGGTVTVNGSIAMNNFAVSLGGLAGAGDVANGGAGAGTVLTVGGNNLSTTYSGILQNTGTAANMALTKTGVGTLTLSGANKYTGNTLITGGVLQLGVNEALTGSGGTGTAITLGNVAGPASVTFDLNGNTQTLQAATALTFYGTTSTNTTSARVNIGSGGNLILKGNVVATTNATASNGFLGGFITGGTLTLDGAARTFTIADSLNAADDLTITSNIVSTGGGSLTKAGAGTLTLTADSISLTGTLQVDAGTLRVSGTGNSFGALSGAGGTVSLGNTVTFGADNSSPGAFAGTVSGVGGLIKTGSGTMILSGTTINYTGATTVNVGALSITGSSGAALTTSALKVAGGATFNTFNTAGQNLDLGSGALSLGTAAQTTILGFELGADTAGSDRITTSAVAATAGTLQLNLAGLASFGGAGDYDLISAASGLSGATYTIGSVAGGYTYSFTNTDSLIQLNVAAAGNDTLYWRGDLSSSWSTLSGSNTNWYTNSAGTTNAGFNPGALNSVIFSTSNNAGGNIVTTLDNSYSIKDLTFNALSASPTDSVTINAGTAPLSTLTIANGINVAAGSVTNAVTINVPVVLGAAQTWNVADAATVLTINGALSGGLPNSLNTNNGGSTSLTITGAGSVTLGSNANTFTGDIVVDGGGYNVDSLNDWGGPNVANSTSKTITLTNGGRLNVIAGTLNPTAIGTGTDYKLIQIGSGGGTINTSSGATLQLDDANQLFGSGTLTKTGVGTLSLRNQGGFTGAIIIAAGTLQPIGGTGSNFGTIAAGTTIQSGAALNLNGISVAEAEPVTISGSGLASAPAGAITNSSGTAATFGGPITLGADATIGGGVGALTLSAGATVNIGAFTLTLAHGTGRFTTNGVISGTGAVVVNGSSSGDWVTGVSHLYSGGTTLNAGSRTILSSSSVGVGAGVTSGPFGTGTLILNGGELRSGTGGPYTIGNTVNLQADTLFLTTASEKNLIFAGPVTITGATRTLTSAVGTTVANTTVEFSGAIGDGGNGYGLTKEGAGNLTLSGTNTYGGTTTINAGTLRVGNGGATGDLSSGPVVNNAALVFNRTGSLTVSGAVSGNGSITKNGAGTVVLSNAGSSNNGTITVNGGTLSVNPSAIATATGITVGSATTGSILDLYADGAAATTNLASATNITLGGTGGLSGALGFQLGASGTSDQLVFSGGGSLTIGSGGVGLINASAIAGFGAGTWTLVSGGTANSTTFGLGALPGGFGYSLTQDATTLSLTATAAAGANYFWAGDVNGSWSGFSSGGSNTNWSNDSGSNTDPGATPGTGQTVNFNITTGAANFSTTLDNAFSIAGLNFLNNGSAVTIAPGVGGTLQIGSGGITVNTGAPTGSTISAPVILGANNTWTVTDAATTLTVSGAVSQDIAGRTLTKAGAGTLVLTGTNSYSGLTSVSAGVLQVANNSALGGGAVTLSGSGAILELANGMTISNTPLTFSSTTGARTLRLQSGATSGTYSGNIVLSETTNTDSEFSVFSGGTLTLTGVLSSVGFEKAGAGTVVLDGSVANTYTGATTVTNGVLNIRRGDSLGTTAAGVTIAAGSALELQHVTGFTVGAEAITSIRGTGPANGGALRNISGTNTWGGLITMAAASRINSDSGTLILDVASGNAVTGTFGLTLGGAGNGEIRDVIATSTGTLTKDGTGTWSLRPGAVNTYTGATIVNNGVLLLDYANATPTTNMISASSVLTLGGGTLSVQGKAATVISQTFASTGLTAGTYSVLAADSNGATSLAVAMGTLTRNANSSINFDLANSPTVTLTLGASLSNATGIITATSSGAAVATFNKTDWATMSGSNPVAYTGYVMDTFTTSANNIDVTTSAAWAGTSLNTLRFNAATPTTLTLSGVNTLDAGGILIGSGAGAVTIGGTGTLAGADATGTTAAPVAGELGVFQHSATAATISAAIVNHATGLSHLAATPSGTVFNKYGAGTLILTNTRNAWTGGTNIAGGTLQLGAANVIADGIGNPGLLSIAAGGTLDMNGFSEIINGLSGSGMVDNTSASAVTLTVGNGTLAGSVTSTFSGIIRNTGGGAISLLKTGTGTLTLSGVNAYTGTTTLGQGNLTLNFTAAGAPLSNILPSTSALTLGTGTLSFTGSTALNTQSFASTTLAGGASVATTGTTPAMTVNLGALTRNTGSTLAVLLGTSPTGSTTTTTANTGASILGGWAVQGATVPTTWAVSAGNGTTAGAITGLATGSYLTTTTAGNTAANYLTTSDVDVTSSPTLSAGVTINSLRFNTSGANTVTLTGTNTINTGGILVTATVGSNNQTISGGTIRGSASGELIIHNYNTNTNRTITINSLIANNGGATGLTINAGTGTVSLRTSTNTYTGQTVINGGTLSIDVNARVATSAGITLNGGTLALSDNFSMDRRITLGLAGGTLSTSAQDGATVWSNTGAILFVGSGPRTLTLTGDTDQDLVTLNAAIGDGGGPTSLIVNGGTDDSIHVLTPTGSSTYSGNTILSRGMLRLNSANAIGGGMTSAATIGNFIFTATGVTRAILEINATSGAITRSLGYGPGQMHWEGNGGFSNNSAATQIVNLGGSGDKLTWGVGGFVPTGNRLQFGNFIANSNFSTGTIDFQNAIELGTAVRTIEAARANGTTTDRTSAILEAILSGNITSGVGGGIAKEGTGTIQLTGTNNGGSATVAVNVGTLYFGSSGAILGTGANLTLSTLAGGNAAIGVAGDTNPITTFAGRIANAGASTAAFLLSADSSATLDFSAYPNMRLSALAFQNATTTPTPLANAVTFTGSITPASGTYRFGGQAMVNGVTNSAASTLVLARNHILTGSNSLNMSFGGLTLTAPNNYTGGTVVNGNAISVPVVGIGSDAAFGTGTVTLAGTRQVNFGAVNGDHSVSNNIAFDGAATLGWVAGADGANDSILANVNQGTLSYLGTVDLGGLARSITGRPRGTLFLGDITGSAAGLTYAQTAPGYFSFLATSANGGTAKTYSGTTTLGDNTNLVIDSADSLGTSGSITLGSSIILLQPGTSAVTLNRNFVNTGAKNPSFNIAEGSTLTLTGTMSGSTTGVLVKQGVGTLVLAGDATGLLTTGTVQVRSGTLRLDAATFGGTVLTNVGITLGSYGVVANPTSNYGNGATLEITGTSAQSFGTLTVNPRANSINLTGATTLTLGAINRTTTSTLNFQVPTGTVTTTGAAIAGLVNGSTTWNGDDWAGVTGSGPASIGAYTGYTTLAGVGPTIASNATANYLLTTGGSGDVTLDAPGTLGAPNNANTLKFSDTNARTIDLGSGFLRLGTGGAAGGGVTNAGGILVASGSGALTITGGSLMAGGTTTNTLGDLVFINNSTSDITVSSAIVNNNGTTGATQVVYDGRSTGKLILSGANTFTGAISINRGVLEVTTVNSVASAGSLGQGTAASGNILLNGGTFRANLSADGATDKGFTVQGPSTIEVVANTLTLNTTLNGPGATSSDIYQNALLFAGILKKTGAGTLELKNLTTNANNANLSIEVVAGTLLLNKTSTSTFAAVDLAGGAALIIDSVGAGSAPTVRISGTGGNQISDASSVVIMGGVVNGVLDLNGLNETIDGLAGSGTVTTGVAGTATLTLGGNNSAGLSPYTLAAAAAGVNATGLNHFSGTLSDGSGTLALTKVGSGTQILSSAQSYSGATTISAGTLRLGIANALPSGTGKSVVTIIGNNTGVATGGSGLVLAPGTLDMGGYNQAINGLDSTTGGFVTNNPTLAYNGSAWAVAAGVQGTKTLTLGNSDAVNASFNGVIQDGFSVEPGVTATGFVGGINLVKVGTNTQTLKGANTYGGTTAIQNGILVAGFGTGATGNVNRLPSTTEVTLGESVGGTSGILQLGDANGAVSQIIAGLTTSGGLAASNKVVGGNASNSTLILNQTVTSTYSGALGGAGTNENNLNFTLQGGGTLTLTGANTHTGATTIQGASTLVLGSNIASSAVNVGGTGAGTLTGTGFSIGGLVTVNSGGLLTPGTILAPVANETLALTAGLSLNGGTLAFGLGTYNDLINVSGGTFTVGTSSFISLTEVGTLSLGTYDLIDYTGSGGLSGAHFDNLSLTSNVIGASNYVATLIHNVGANKVQLLIDNARFWSAQTNGVWDVNSTANWTPGLRYLDGDKVIFADTFPPGTAPGTTTVTLDTTVTPGAITFTNATLGYSLSGGGNISGAAALSKSGAGAVMISLNNSNYTGSAGISAGSIEMQHANALGTGSVSVSGTGELRLSGGISTNSSLDLTLNGAGVSNTGSLRNLSGNNTYAGVITLGGVSRINSDAGTLSLSGGITNGSNNLTFGGAGNVTVSGVIGSGAGTLTVDGTGIVTLGNAASTYTGKTFIKSGTLSVAKLANAGNNSGLGAATGVASVIAIGDAATTGTLRWTGSSNDTTDRVIDLAGTTGGAIIDASGTGGAVLTLSSPMTFTGAGAKTLTLTGTGGSIGTPNVITGGIGENSVTNTTSLLKTGSGVWRLDGANTYTGTTTINGGILLLGANQTLSGLTLGGAAGYSATLGLGSFVATLAGDVTYSATGNPLGASITGSGSLDLGGDGLATISRTFTVGQSSNSGGADLAISAAITDTAGVANGITKAGAGTLVLTGANTYTGATTVDSGTLSVTPGALTNTSVINVGTNGTAGQLALHADNSATPVTLKIDTNLNIGSGTSLGYLGFDLSGASSSDAITLAGTGALTVGAAGGVVNARALGTLTGTSYLLLDTTNTGSVSIPINAVNGFYLGVLTGGYSYSLDNTTTTGMLYLTVGAAAAGPYYWTGAQSTDSWAQLGSGGTTSNWATNLAGTVDAGATPGNIIVRFSADNAGASAINTTLDQAYSILGLEFLGNTPATGNVSIAAGAGAGTLTLGSGGIDIQTGASSTSTTISAPVVLGASQSWGVADSGQTLTVSGVVSGSGNLLTKTGAGTLVLSGVNTFNGGTTINGGTVQINNANSLGATSGTATINNATLQVTADILESRVFSLDNANSTISVNATRTLTISGTNLLTGIGTLNASGAGTLKIEGSNNFSGGSILSGGGTVQINTSSSLGSGDITLNEATLQALATLTDSGRTYTIGNSASAILVDSGKVFTITSSGSDKLTGAGTLNTTGAGTLVLSDSGNSNDFSGGSVLGGGGTVRISTNTGLGSGAITINNATLNATATITDTGRNYALGNAASALTVNSGTTYTIINGASTKITGTGVLNANGPGILVLDDLTNANANDFTGGSVLSGLGTVRINTATSLGAQSGDATIKDATLQATEDITTTRNFILASYGSTLLVDNTKTLTISGLLSDGFPIGTLNKTGAGTLDLTRAAGNTYTGGTFVTGGILLASNTTGSATGAGAVSVTGSGSTLGGAGIITGAVTIGGAGAVLSPGTATAAGTLTLGSLTLSAGSVLNYQLGAINASDKTVVTASGGFTANGGTFNLTGLAGLTNGTYNLITYTDTLGGSFSNLSLASNYVTGGGNTYYAALVNNTGSVDLTTTNSLTWNGNQGGTVWQSGTSPSTNNNWKSGATTDLDFFNTMVATFDDTAASFTVNVASAGVEPSSITVNAANDYVFTGAGAISGATGITKSGAGALTINLANTFNGNIALLAGSIEMKDPAALGTTGTISITPGASLLLNNDGSGDIALGTRIISYSGGGVLRNVAGNNTATLPAVTLTSATSFISDAGKLTLAGNITSNSLAVSLIGNGGDIELTGGTISGGNFNFTSNMTGGAATVGNNINVGTSSVIVNGTGATTFNGTLTSSSTGAGLSVSNSGTNLFNNTVSVTGTAGGITLAGSSINTFVSGKNVSWSSTGTLAVASSGNTTFNGTISGSGALTKSGAGTLTLNATSGSYTGAVNLAPASGQDRGIIVAAADNALGTGAVTATFFTGAAVGQLQLSGGITLGNSSFTTTGDGSDGTVSGIIRSTSGANIITGTVTLATGGGSSTFRADSGSSLAFNGAVTASATGRFVNLVGGGDFSFGAAGSINNGGSNTLGLWSTNSGTTTINSTANTYTLATAIGSGSTLVIADLSDGGSNSSIGAASTAETNLVIDNGTLTYSGATGAQSTNRLFSIGDGGATLNASGSTAADTMSFTGVGSLGFNGISGIGTSALETGDRTLTLTGNNTGANTLASIIGDQDTGGGNLTSVAKTGAGTWVLTGANTYTGTTTINGGTLQVGDGSSGSLGGAGTVTVSTSGTKLSGSGSIAGSTILGNGTILALGVGDTSTSNKTLIFTAATTSISAANDAQIQLGVTTADSIDGSFATWFHTNGGTAADYLTTLTNGIDDTTWNSAPAGGHDFITAAGTIVLGSSATADKRIAVSLNSVTGLTYGSIFNLLDWSTFGTKDGTSLFTMSGGAAGGNFNIADNLLLEALSGGLAWDTSVFNSHGILVVVPEPSRALLLMLGLLGLMLRRRRR